MVHQDFLRSMISGFHQGGPGSTPAREYIMVTIFRESDRQGFILGASHSSYWAKGVEGFRPRYTHLRIFLGSSLAYSLRRLFPDNFNNLIHWQADWNIRQLAIVNISSRQLASITSLPFPKAQPMPIVRLRNIRSTDGVKSR